VLFLASLLSPIDVMLIDKRVHCGTREGGLRLVPLVYGMPREHKLEQQYGEWYEGGCFAPSNPPTWLLTWN
ncbi:MAG TPA: hypothetical protein VFW73_06400, partial [Lacipirellulaceae bacterium]|nr:hypothetical protein [Lacipirellulaceae bacterium]